MELESICLPQSFFPRVPRLLYISNKVECKLESDMKIFLRSLYTMTVTVAACIHSQARDLVSSMTSRFSAWTEPVLLCLSFSWILITI